MGRVAAEVAVCPSFSPWAPSDPAMGEEGKKTCIIGLSQDLPMLWLTVPTEFRCEVAVGCPHNGLRGFEPVRSPTTGERGSDS